MKKVFYFLFLLLISCVYSPEFTIGFPKNSTYDLPVKVGYDSKMFKPKQIKLLDFKNPNSVIKKVLDEKIDLAIIPLITLWDNNEIRNEFEIIGYYQREGSCFAAKDTISSPIGIIDNSLESYLCDYLIENDSVKYQTQTYKNFSALKKAYESRKINSVCLSMPQLFELGKFNEKVWLTKYFGRYPNSVLIAKKSYYQANRSKFDKALPQLSQACKYYNQNLKLARSSAYLLAGISDVNISDFTHELRFVISYDEKGKEFEKIIGDKGKAKQIN